MPAATNRAELVAVTKKEWTKLMALVAHLPGERTTAKDENDTSIKDVLAHRAHWLGLFFQWLEEGEVAEMPDHGVTWSDLASYNARLRARHAPMGWSAVLRRLAAQHERFTSWLARADEAALYGGPMPGGNGKWTTGRYAEAAGPSHYRSAAKYIRGRIRAAR
jgi:hypothetical protein